MTAPQTIAVVLIAMIATINLVHSTGNFKVKPTAKGIFLARAIINPMIWGGLLYWGGFWQ